MMAFDFAHYLSDLTGFLWTIEELSGGNANYTVRGTLQYEFMEGLSPVDPHSHGQQARSELLQNSSIVLKQAPPYFAKFPEMRFSQSRQMIEAKALTYFYSGSAPQDDEVFGLSSILPENPSVVVPRLLYHDEASYVLVQSDLGAHPNLGEFILNPDTSATVAYRAGVVLGHFLGTIHTHPLPSGIATEFENADAEKVMHGVIDNVEKFMSHADIPDASELATRAHRNWRERRKSAFGQGDIWFGTVLVDTTKQEGVSADETESQLSLGICDWEFAGPNHPAGDLAQLGAYLHLCALSPLLDPSQRHVLHSFAIALYGSYFERLCLPLEERPEFLRSLLIMHGWELINAAAWRHELWCKCSGDGVKCDHVRGMVLEGAKFLRAVDSVNDSEDQYVNWDELRDIQWCDFFKAMREPSGPLVSNQWHGHTVVYNETERNQMTMGDAIEYHRSTRKQ